MGAFYLLSLSGFGGMLFIRQAAFLRCRSELEENAVNSDSPASGCDSSSATSAAPDIKTASEFICHSQRAKLSGELVGTSLKLNMSPCAGTCKCSVEESGYVAAAVAEVIHTLFCEAWTLPACLPHQYQA